jgi:ABC-type nitrate/sulfonate/bicarbonate transport system permease component
MAWVAGLAVFALLLTGWRKNARAQPRDQRAALEPDRVPHEVVHVVTEPYRPAGPMRRLWAALASTGLVIVLGAVVATVIAFGVAIVVTTLTELLRR